MRLALSGVTAGRLVDPVDVDVRAGEIVGIGGLVGSGRSTVLEATFGLRRRSGTVAVDGRALRPALTASGGGRPGSGYVPEDRREHGLAMDMSVRANATFAESGRGALDRGAVSRARDLAR